MMLNRRQFLALTASSLASTGQTKQAPRSRAECFFGVHFDLHPRDTDTALGRDVTEEMIERFLERVQPDYVQYDYKGHPGFIGYPSKVSRSAPIVRDSLALWRKVTARHGVRLYIHFSGVWDEVAVEDHPEWARVDAQGRRDNRLTSTFSEYVDQRMIPQLKEAIDQYQIDGAWVDGECWAVQPDYHPNARTAFHAGTGLGKLPQTPDDPGWREFLELNREQFRRYVRRYVDELHRYRPGFEIASNWLYTTYVPERPQIPVDFISGDYLGNAALARARLEARYLSSVGKPWDLMAWGFQSGRENPVGPVHKPAVQLMQEAAVVLAQGGGFQVYYQPTRTGYLDERHIEVMADLARFCRQRQQLCHRSETVPEVGILFSSHSLYNTVPKLFGGWGSEVDPAQGWVDLLVENQIPTDVIPDWRLAELAASYACIIVPEWPDIGHEATQILLDYLRDGGRLLIAGAENAHRFIECLQVELRGRPRRVAAYVPGKEVFANASGLWQDIEPTTAFVVLHRYPTYDSTRDAHPAATLNSWGDGRVLAVYGPVGIAYAATHAPELRRVLGNLVRQLYEPSLTFEGPPTVELVRRTKAGKQILHLLNATNMQVATNYSAIDFVPPVGPMRIRLRLQVPPQNPRWEPGNLPVRGRWEDGRWIVELERLELHRMLVWE